ncbi:MAG: NAD(P)/FAD-dependent oxidoreductase [Xanthomonadales bacterium]|nr:NAD(P)/FAD-dependent oxidoreductase [Xanthomonadales bacterium]
MTDAQGKSAVVIGAGHNGLTCAAYLAKEGYAVSVLEASTTIGGPASTHEFAPGFRASVAHLLYQLEEEIIEDLQLEAHGFSLAADSLDTVALDLGGKHLQISGDKVLGEDVSREDRDALMVYRGRMMRFAKIIGGLHDKVPPRLASGERSDTLGLAKLAWAIRRLGKTEMREFLRIAGINVYDILEELFEHELLKGALSLDGVLGTHLGPRSNNSVFTALHRMSGSVKGTPAATAIPRGGMGGVSNALAEAAKALGVSIIFDARVGGIEMEGDRATGVTLTTGEVMPADVVVSSADPKTTFLDIIGARRLDAGMVRKISHVRQSGNAAKLHLALDALPEFSGLDQDLLGQRLVIAPDLDYVERAFNHAKYGEHSAEPIMEITLPTVHDPGLAPDGKHVLSALVQYAPRELKSGWDDARATFTEAILSTLERYAPAIRDLVTGSELLTPEDIEARHGNIGGHWHHAELALDQFLMLRPVAGAAQYRSPIDGLYLCGSGCHPGGGVMGHAGRNAARCITAENEE